VFGTTPRRLFDAGAAKRGPDDLPDDRRVSGAVGRDNHCTDHRVVIACVDPSGDDLG